MSWILLGIVSTFAAANRWGIPALGWLAGVPFLIAAGRVQGRGWLLLGLAVFVAQTLAVVKIITAPLPLAMSLTFGLPMAIGAMAMLAVWRLMRTRAGSTAAIYGWAAIVALSDWMGFAHSELSAWTTSANGVASDPIWMQVTALGGMGLLGALVALPGAWLAAAVLDRRPARLHGLCIATILFVAAQFGAVRLDRGLDAGPVVRVAAVTTEVGLGPDGAPDDATLLANEEGLFRRSELAVARGARVVVWNEAATFVPAEREAALLERGAAFAGTHAVDLLLAYAVPVSTAPLRFRNEYAWLGPDGEVQRYAKHHPVPGEPSVRGDEPLQAVDRPWGRAAGAICYDWDFPAVARTYAAQGAGVAFVPASDWRGIDPQHTMMAGVRAVESGMSVLRPVRAATSAGFDAYGRVRGSMRAGDGVLVVDLPTTPVPTPYARFGDGPVLAVAGLTLLGVAVLGLRRRGPAG